MDFDHPDVCRSLETVEGIGRRALELESNGDVEGARKLFEDATAELFRCAADQKGKSATENASATDQSDWSKRALSSHLKGNEYFKGKDHASAKKAYQLAIEHADKVLPNDENWSNAQELKIKVHCNLAQCELAVREYKSAVDYCSYVLLRDPHNIKALWRRSQGQMSRGELDEADRDLDLLVSTLEREDESTTTSRNLEIAENRSGDGKRTKRASSVSSLDTAAHRDRLRQRVKRARAKIRKLRAEQIRQEKKLSRRLFSSSAISGEGPGLYEDKSPHRASSSVPTATPLEWKSHVRDAAVASLKFARWLVRALLYAVWTRVTSIGWWRGLPGVAFRVIQAVGRALRGVAYYQH